MKIRKNSRRKTVKPTTKRSMKKTSRSGTRRRIERRSCKRRKCSTRKNVKSRGRNVNDGGFWSWLSGVFSPHPRRNVTRRVIPSGVPDESFPIIENRNSDIIESSRSVPYSIGDPSRSFVSSDLESSRSPNQYE